MDPACRREVSIEIPAAEFQAELESRIKQYQKLARIPGFRQGKVPESIIRRRFMADIRTEVFEHLIPRHFREVADREKLVPVSQPQITELKTDEGQPITFKAAFEVMPDFTVTGYKELTVERPNTDVTEAEIEDALKELQQRQASYEVVEERELRDGDFALVSFTAVPKGTQAIAEKKAGLAAEGKPPATEEKPVEVADVLVDIGGATTVKEFSDNLRGARPGEERSFDVHYPDDFSDQRLAGQVMHYDLKVQGVKKKVVPDLSDDFAKELGDFATLAGLRKRLRENMEQQKKHDLEHAAREKMVNELVERNPFPVPLAMIERQVDARLERGLRAMAAQGMRQDQMKKLDFSRLRQGQREAAAREVRASLILEKIADTENIQVSAEEVEKEVQSFATQMGQPLEAVRARLEGDGTVERIRERLRNEKAIDFLYQAPA